jgi:hypothetical protein
MKYFLALGGKILAGKKAREDMERNRKRLKEAALVSRELRLQRIADEEIKKIVIHLVYEADGYIAAAQENEGALYEPLVLDALDTARAAVNAWKKSENEAAAGKYLRVSGPPSPDRFVVSAGFVIPAEAGAGQAVGNETREKTLEILRESLRLFMFHNSIRAAGDPDAALAALAGQERD